MKNCICALRLTIAFGVLFGIFSCKDELSFQSSQVNTLKTSTLVQSTVVNLMDPVRYVRENGKPLTELKSIPGYNQEVFESAFQLKIKNVIASKLAINSAIIKIDGEIVVSSRDFDKKQELISKEVPLKPEGSVLEVQINGKPGSSVDLWIEGTLKDASLVAYFPFNGNPNDESNYMNNGTLSGPVVTSDRFGNENSAYLFDGSNDFIRIEESPSLKVSTGLSVCAWVKCLQISDHGRIVSKWGYGSTYYCSFDLCFTSWADALFEVSQENIPTGIGYGPVTTNEWYFLVGTLDGANIQLYINGELKSSTPFSETLCQGIPVFIGGENGTQLFFNGVIDDVRIYNRALSPAEILELYYKLH